MKNNLSISDTCVEYWPCLNKTNTHQIWETQVQLYLSCLLSIAAGCCVYICLISKCVWGSLSWGNWLSTIHVQVSWPGSSQPTAVGPSYRPQLHKYNALPKGTLLFLDFHQKLFHWYYFSSWILRQCLIVEYAFGVTADMWLWFVNSHAHVKKTSFYSYLLQITKTFSSARN